MAQNISPHRLEGDGVNLQGDGAHCRPHHLVPVHEKLGGLDIEGEGRLRELDEEELDGLIVQPHGQRLQQSYVVGKDLLVIEVEGHHYQVVDMVVAEKVIKGSLAPDILDQHRQRLQELHLHSLRCLLEAEHAYEVREDALLTEEIKEVGVVVFAPNECLRYLPHCLNDCLATPLLLQVTFAKLREAVVELLEPVQRVRRDLGIRGARVGAPEEVGEEASHAPAGLLCGGAG
mmetsp:Transcript_53216/g.147435  ORF Transcript_53216/g.147435 Transcript_53216/m.147435 type:complete len:232 (+) Transcript_53216:550-1245(+)